MLIIQLLITGMAQGCLYGIVALSFVIIYKATEAISFVQGDLMMLGAFLGFVAATVFGLPFWLMVPATIVVSGVVGVVIERLTIRPILGEPMFAIIMVTFGLGYVLRGLVTMIPEIGTNTQSLPVPFAGRIVQLGGLRLAAEHLVIIGVTILLCLLLFLMFKYTKVGIAMKATSQNQLAAYYMGIPVRKLNSLVWGLGAVLAAIAGLMMAPVTFVYVEMGFIGLKAFPAAVIGGFGSLPGAIVGGLIIGLLESLSGFYLGEGLKDITPYIAVLVMLVIKPTGLFGERQQKKV